jgi:uncharacterized protein with NRDE domain
MCLIFLSYRQHPEYPLIVLANRDEFYSRATSPANYWSGGSILAGKDLVGGGTWLGMNQMGNFAMLTNYRDLKNLKPDAPTRGKLVADYLTGDFKPDKYLKALDKSASLYNGYNLLLGTVKDPWYYSNYQRKIYQLGTGLYGLSNELLDSPWPKVVKGKMEISELLKAGKLDPEGLFDVMRDSATAKDDQLPNTGLSLTKERALSSMYIATPDYGTRCTTLIMKNKKGEVYFEERTYIPKISKATFEFKV